MNRNIIRTLFSPKTIVVPLALVTATAATAFGPPDPAMASTTATGRTIDWKPCAQAAEVDCGTLTVPVDWAKPKGETTTVALARRRASEPAARIGTLLYNPGGPGGSGVDEIISSPKRFSSEVHRRYDVIGFDPRGIGSSRQVLCDQDVANWEYSIRPTTIDEYLKLLARDAALSLSCRVKTGALAEHLDTTAIARDMDAIRIAVGEPKLNYYGKSYGTLMGQSYLELFPDTVGRITLDSNMDHSQRTAEEWLVSQSAASENALNQFIAWCDRTPNCAVHRQGAAGVLDQLYELASKNTLIVTDPWGKTGNTDRTLLSRIVRTFLGERKWKAFGEWLATASKNRNSGQVAAPGSTGRNTASFYGESFGFPDAVLCQEWSFPFDGPEEMTKLLDRATAVAARMGPSWEALYTIANCRGWIGRVNNPQHQLRTTHDLPVLLVGARFDTATPYQWTESVHRQIPGSTLLTYAGAGHGAYFLSPCVSAAVDSYLIDGIRPVQTTCPALEPAA